MLTNDQWKAKLAEAALTAKLSAALDGTYAEAVARQRAGFIKVDDDGVVDAGALTIQYGLAMQEAPGKMRNDYRAGGHNGPEFYDELRALVAARHEAKSTGGIDTIAARVGSPPRRGA